MTTETPQAAASLALTIRAWITANPGRHRPNEVAAAIPCFSSAMTEPQWKQRVANEMARMARSGILARGRVTSNESGPGVLYWAAKDAPPLEQHTLTEEHLTCSCGEAFAGREAFKTHQIQARKPVTKKRKK